MHIWIGLYICCLSLILLENQTAVEKDKLNLKSCTCCWNLKLRELLVLLTAVAAASLA